MSNLLNITNATKANVMGLVNAVLGVLIAFHVVLTQTQLGAIDVLANAVMIALIGATYKASAMRKPDPAP